MVNLYNVFPLTSFYLYFNTTSVALLTPVIIISYLVNIYSFEYMKGEPFIIRFLGFLNLFSSFMILLVLANCELLQFFGWEGIGLASFLLISYYYNSNNSIKSALSAFFINKIGDLFFMVAIISHIFLGINVTWALIIAAATKSAQFPFFKWLPESMAAPTPVSSLLHAATLVTAGVYLLIQSSEYITPEYNFVILTIGSITTILAGTYALFQYDIKRIIALSTCSQIAMCFVAIGLSQSYLALYHLFNHSFYKALLFLSAGIIIHYVNNIQDIRKYGGLYNVIPITHVAFLVSSLSLIALPGLTGFFSKDLIIESSVASIFAPIIYISGFLTAAYTTKLYLNIFTETPKVNIECHKENLYYIIPLVTLSIFSIFAGYLTSANSEYEFRISSFQKALIFYGTLATILLFVLIRRINPIKSLIKMGYISYITNYVTISLYRISNSLNDCLEQGFIKYLNEALLPRLVRLTPNYSIKYSVIFVISLTLLLLFFHLERHLVTQGLKES